MSLKVQNNVISELKQMCKEFFHFFKNCWPYIMDMDTNKLKYDTN